jgi:hypothetical protein
VGRAVEYARRAGDRALAQLAHDEAARYYASGLDLLGAGGADPLDSRRVELLIGRGEARRRSGDAGYRQPLLDAAHLAEQRGDGAALARAALANTLGYLWTTFSVDTDRIAVLESAIAAAGGEDQALRARLLATLALELTWQPDPTRRVALAERRCTSPEPSMIPPRWLMSCWPATPRSVTPGTWRNGSTPPPSSWRSPNGSATRSWPAGP